MKKILALALAAAMSLSLVACGGGKTEAPAPEASTPAPEASTPAPAPEAETVELTLATYPIGKWSDETTVNGLIADFNAKYPNVKVTVQYLDYTNGDDTVNTAIEAGTAPDIIFEGPERLVANWGAKGYLVDLKDMVNPATYESVIGSCTSADGSVYELPLCMTAHCMAINKDLFEAAGAMQYIDQEKRTWTTENFLKAVDAVYAYGHENVGVIYCGGQGGDQGTRALVTNMYGGTYANAEHTEYTANCAENVKALETIVAQKGINFDPAIVASDEIQLFVNGTLAMAFCWNVAQETNNAEMLGFDAFPLCFPTESGDPKLQGGIWGFGIFNNGDEAKIAAAKDFVAFMTGDDAQYAKAVEATSYWPTREVAGMYDGNDMMTEYGIMVPYMGDYYQITKGWTTARTEWWNALQRIGAGGDVQTELDTFVANANAAAAAEG